MAVRSEGQRSFGRSILALPKIVRRYRRDQSGATAIEFAMLAGPFFVLLFAIIECSLIFFAGQLLESSVDEVARKVRTGQLNNTMTQAMLKTEVCNEASILFDCNKLQLDMDVVATFDELGNPPQPDPNTNDTDFTGFAFDAPCPDEVVMITASYEWPIFTYFTANNIYPTHANNAAFRKILLSAVGVFRTEPWPPAAGGKVCS